MVGGMALHNPPPHPPEDTASSPAREWLEQERRRAEAEARLYPATSSTAADGKKSSDDKTGSVIRFVVVLFVCRLASSYFIPDSAPLFISELLLFPMVLGLLCLIRLHDKRC